MVLAAAAVLGSAYFIFFKDRDDFIWIFAVGLIIGMLSYVFQFQIDQLMIRGVPLRIETPMFQMLTNTAQHFAAMPREQQLLMADRMKRWMIRKDFLNKNEQDAPEDVKYILAYYAVLLTIHQEDFLYKNFDRIVFYHHPFLSPDHSDDVHVVEVESKDGTIIISVPHLLKGHLEKGYYNLALHALADAYYNQYLPHPIDWPENIWHRLEGVSGISREKIEDYLGLPLSDPWPVAVHHQLTYADADIPEVLEHFPQFRYKLMC